MNFNDVRYHRDLPEAAEDAPEGWPEYDEGPPPALPEFELDDIDF